MGVEDASKLNLTIYGSALNYLTLIYNIQNKQTNTQNKRCGWEGRISLTKTKWLLSFALRFENWRSNFENFRYETVSNLIGWDTVGLKFDWAKASRVKNYASSIYSIGWDWNLEKDLEYANLTWHQKVFSILTFT